MRKAALLLIGLLSALAAPAWARTPVVVELYTSQGCSCLKSSALLADLGDKPPVLTLTFAVDYWDYLGWSDTFAKPQFTSRQRDYMTRLGLREVYTPQVVVDGRLEAAAVSADKIQPLIQQAAHAHRDPPQIQFRKTKVAIGSADTVKGGGDVWLIRYDPHDQSVQIKNGENRGQTMLEHNVVRELTRLGPWNGRPKLYDLPTASAEGLSTVVLVQGAHGGHVLAVGQP